MGAARLAAGFLLIQIYLQVGPGYGHWHSAIWLGALLLATALGKKSLKLLTDWPI
jgi:hypothetical protein